MMWLRFPEEASACPACRSRRLTMLDVIPVTRGAKGRRVAFLAGCVDCGLVFTNPMPTEEQQAKYYADEGPYRAHKVEAAEAKRRERKKSGPRPITKAPRARDLLLEALTPYIPVNTPPPGAKVLDFGCGDGKMLNRLQDAGWETYGIEPSTSVAFTRHRRLTEPPRDGPFDFVILHHVLEHVRDPLEILKQLGGATREGGRIFISLPGLDTLPLHGNFKYCLDGRKHLMCFSEACLTTLLARAGFATTATIRSKELDAALTDGQPLRLRLIATRTSSPAAPPLAPLDAAITALSQFARRRSPLAARARGILPVRMRAALLNRSRERDRLRREA
jgi:2-polyprenyl-3-methyl-5-hydroxy-6-metoxy-1,4-benzoquinol methylase